MTHDWMRQKQVDILAYLPEFLQKSPLFKGTNDADSKEHETIRTDLQDLLDQCFISSATWGLAVWEQTLGLQTVTTNSYDLRRKQIINKLQSKQTSTLKLMDQIVNTYGYGYIEGHYDEYYFNIYTTVTDSAQIKKMKQDVMLYKPAHLGVNVYLGFSWNGKINFDGTYTYGTSMQKWEE